MTKNQGFQGKACIEAISPYVAGKPIDETAREYGLDVNSIVKLASNENPFGMPPSARKALAEAPLSATRYPDGNARRFREAVAAHMGVAPDWVIAGNGSDEILGLVARLVLQPGSKCVYSQYSFSVYELSAQENGAECVCVPARGFAVDLEAMAAAVDADTRLVFITNPNNPTGLVLPAADIEAFVARVPGDCVVVLDEAYVHYMPREARVDAVGLVRRHPNVLVARTFSKAYGLAGIRAGFAVAQPAMIEMLNRIRPPFNMNALSQIACAGCIGDEDFLAMVYEENRKGVARLEAFFAAQGLRYLPTQANFILVQVGARAAAVNEGLLRRGVIVRPVRSYGLPDWLRVSVGSPEENDRFMAAFAEARAEAGA
ncbi:MAG: histidinol-phosphate transaminase [Duodenibacillus sp.]|nr:histidinol-phosphate transaminase [Duodenibacillus sp.]